MAEYSLPLVSYYIAYFVLPYYAYQDFERAQALWIETPNSAGPLYYFTGCQVAKVEPRPEDAKGFSVECVRSEQSVDFYVMRYPDPPPYEPLNGDDFLKQIERGTAPVLAPYFSVIVRQRETGVISYFVLGQSPSGGTTFRSVSAEGANANHGPGPEPRLDAFLERVSHTLGRCEA